MSVPGQVIPDGYRKLTFAGAGGALTVILVWLLSLAEIEMPTHVAQAFTILFALGCMYPVRNSLRSDNDHADGATE